MSDEWGPWVEHDGKGCPCLGKVVRVTYGKRRGGPIYNRIEEVSETDAIEIADGLGSWTWKPGWNPIIRYRIRKPRALIDMIERAAELDRVKETT